MHLMTAKDALDQLTKNQKLTSFSQSVRNVMIIREKAWAMSAHMIPNHSPYMQHLFKLAKLNEMKSYDNIFIFIFLQKNAPFFNYLNTSMQYKSKYYGSWNPN